MVGRGSDQEELKPSNEDEYTIARRVLRRLEDARDIVTATGLAAVDVDTAAALVELGAAKISDSLLHQSPPAAALSRLVEAAGGLQRADVFLSVIKHSPFLDGSLALLLEPALKSGSFTLSDSLREHYRETLARLALSLVALADESQPQPSSEQPLEAIQEALAGYDAEPLLDLITSEPHVSGTVLDKTLIFSYGLFLQAILLRHSANLFQKLLSNNSKESL